MIVRRKGAGTLRVRATGRAAHSGSAPQHGRNALLALAHAAIEVAATADPRGPDRLTVVPTIVRSGDALNVVPASGELVFDMRADDTAAFRGVLEAVPGGGRRRDARGGAGARLAGDGLGARRPRRLLARRASCSGARSSRGPAAAPATRATSPRRSRSRSTGSGRAAAARTRPRSSSTPARSPSGSPSPWRSRARHWPIERGVATAQGLLQRHRRPATPHCEGERSARTRRSPA